MTDFMIQLSFYLYLAIGAVVATVIVSAVVAVAVWIRSRI